MWKNTLNNTCQNFFLNDQNIYNKIYLFTNFFFCKAKTVYAGNMSFAQIKDVLNQNLTQYCKLFDYDKQIKLTFERLLTKKLKLHQNAWSKI